MMKYYLVDWFAFLFTFLSIYYLGKHKKSGFLFGIIGYFCWIVVNIIAEIIPGVILSIVMIGMSVNSFRKWKKREVKVKSKRKKK